MIKRLKQLCKKTNDDSLLSDNFLNIEKIKPLKRIYENNYIPIAFASSNYFVPYLAITIQSLLMNSDKNTNYDLVIFNKDISEQSQERLKSFCAENVSLRFINVSNIFKNTSLYTPGHVTIETYFRLIIPLYMKNYEKILFLDSDLLILDDIKTLYSYDISEYALGATEECLMSALLGIYGDDAVNYMYEQLHLKDIDKYFQAGVMIMNINYFNKNNCSKKLLEMVMNFNYNIVDQDALNELLNDKVYWLPNEWNYPPLQVHMKEANYIKYMSENIRNKYLSIKNPKIIHFADREKPWFYPMEDYADLWWSYARKSQFYEQILKNMCENSLNPKIETSHLSLVNAIYDIKHYKGNVIKYWKYKLLRNIVFGKMRNRYIHKKALYKHKIENVKSFIK